MTGLEFDRSLRSGAQQGESSLAAFGSLLAATQSGGPVTTVTFDTTGFPGPIIGVLVCSGPGPGPEISVTRGDNSLLWFKSEGCGAENIYSGQSQPIGGVGGLADLQVTAVEGITFSLVLEQVA